MVFKPPSLWYFVTTILRKIFKLVTEVLGRLGSLEHEAHNLADSREVSRLDT